MVVAKLRDRYSVSKLTIQTNYVTGLRQSHTHFSLARQLYFFIKNMNLFGGMCPERNKVLSISILSTGTAFDCYPMQCIFTNFSLVLSNCLFVLSRVFQSVIFNHNPIRYCSLRRTFCRMCKRGISILHHKVLHIFQREKIK